MKSLHNHTPEALLELIISFIKETGIIVMETPVAPGSFFPGIAIENGQLLIDKAAIEHPGDLLHEAGHIAVVPSAERSVLGGNIQENRPGTSGEEIVVMLWTWAACKYLDLDPAIVFHEKGYKGESEWIINNYREKAYIGLPLLVWMGMTEDAASPNGFPLMKTWLRN